METIALISRNALASGFRRKQTAKKQQGANALRLMARLNQQPANRKDSKIARVLFGFADQNDYST